jgi:hypothetical protein
MVQLLEGDWNRIRGIQKWGRHLIWQILLRDIHTELADLNKEAAVLAAKIQENFEELGI